MAEMIFPAVALAVFSLLQSASTVSDSNRGSRLYKDCQGAIQDSEGIAGADRIAGTFCLGYIDGFTDGLVMAGDKIVCVSGASLVTLARVYVAYMAQHPKLMDAAKEQGLTGALIENYECPLPKK